MRPTRVVRTSGFCGLVFLSAGPVAVLGQVPGQVQPGQIERQFQRPPEPRTQPGELRVPAPSQQPPANAAEIKFTLAGVAIEGATVYPAAVLQPYYQKYLNREVSLADVYAVAAALSARYRNDGYILSQVVVPAQSVEGGRVRLQAVEGYVARTVIEGGVDAQRGLVTVYADKIKATRPLTAAALARYLLLMNDLPGAFARATLVASKTEQGASDLLVQFSQRRARGGLSVDNRGGRALGPVRWSADLELDSAHGRHDRTGIKIVSTLNRELDYLSLS